MILKIQRYLENEDWWMLDGIRKVSRTTYHVEGGQEEIRELEILDHDILILDVRDKIISGNFPAATKDVRYIQPQYTYIILVCRTLEGNEFSVIFDTLAYLCNDLGQTVEKLVANYR